MDLRKLEIFVSVANEGSFSRAAEQLHMAQPAVSIAIRKLEEQLDTLLFDRSGRQATLTAEGTALLGQAQLVLDQVEQLEHSAGSMKHLLSGVLKIACPSMLATYYLPELLSGFLSDYPGLRASVSQAGTGRIEQMLLDSVIEIGVITQSDRGLHSEIECVPLIDEQMVLCVASDHVWAKKRSVAITDLHQQSMVVYESGYFIRAQLDSLCAQHGVEPSYRMQSNFLPLLLKMVKQGLGTTVGIKLMAEDEPGMVGVPIKPATRVRMALAKRSGRTISRANQMFFDWVANHS